MRQYPIEQYRKQIPKLEVRAKAARTLATWWALLGAFNMIVGALTGDMLSFIVAGVLLVCGLGAAVARKTWLDQVDMIERDQMPYGVRRRLEKLDLDERLAPVEPKDFADEIESAQREGERKAEREHQWWRQEGSLWHETQQFIDSTDGVIKASETAEFNRMLEEQAKALAAEKRERERRAQELETARRVEATKRWLEQEREWDAFVEDAQVSARERKERGDWYEPPAGVPGALYQAEEDDGPMSAAAGRMTLAEFQLKYGQAALSDRILGSFEAGARAEQLLGRNSSPGRCPRTSMPMYSQRQIALALRSVEHAGVGHLYTFSQCGLHWHLIRKTR